MNHPNDTLDQAIDRVLQGLRDVAPLQGMERRILAAVKERSALRHGGNSAWPFAMSKSSRSKSSRSWMLAVASVAIVAMSAAWFMSRNHRSANHSAELRRQEFPSTALAPRTTASDIESVQPPRAKRYIRATPSLTAPALEELSDEDALALSEMNAPSRPAPPLPLTRQEKLLAEAAHQAGPEELSSLSPDARAKQMELSKAEFHDFFEPPPAKDNE